MRRHSLIARLGPADTASVSIQMTDSVETEIRFIDGQRKLSFGLGPMIDQLAARGIVPSETAIDLAVLAATVTAADTRISRTADSQDSWTREIDLYVAVLDPALWLGASAPIERMLKFLTGDRWRVFFRERHPAYRQLISRPRALIRQRFSSVCLFSGGLDSFVGAIDLLAAGQTPLLVSHYWDLSTSSQELCAQRIGTVYGDMRPRHVRAHVGFDRNDFSREMDTESTTRGRSFLFFALAALAASGLNGEPTIYIYVTENGLISLNVPLDPLRVGAWSTRTTHPFYMARWQELLGHLGIRANLSNPYRFKTKGQMLSECRNTGLLERELAETISCSSFSKARYQKLSPRHCGFCVPCLIRRAAIITAFRTDPTSYTIPDLRARPLNSESAEGEHVRSFQIMARRLSQRPGIERILIHKSGLLSDYSIAEIADYAGVFSRGIMEVASLVDPVVVHPR
jgi:hypothetical protein